MGSSSILHKNSVLEDLQSSDQQLLLDEIDKLRLHGISEDIQLPQIVVCGDQSSGKSSALEAISGLPFPRSDVLCTRFATEVILRPSHEPSMSASIIYASTSNEGTQSKVLETTNTINDPSAFEQLIERAKTDMGLSAGGAAFSKDILRIQISGPKQPSLTLVDLPGLIHVNEKDSSDHNTELISSLVDSYISEERSIILAVVSAKNDIANQIILTRAKEFDSHGQRTLGLITKPDTLPEGSPSEAAFFQLANNSNIEFKLGWHVLKNRDYESRGSTAEQRDRSEETFFSKGVWNDLSKNIVGVASLRHRLTKILLDQIVKHLPSLVKEIQSGIDDCSIKLHKLGDSRENLQKQQQFLFRKSEQFQQICRAAIDGHYQDPFFGDGSTQEGRNRRLRAVLQNENKKFARLMQRKGQRRRIRGDVEESDSEGGFSDFEDEETDQIVMSRKSAIKWVKEILVASSGRELPGSSNPLLVGELFRDQSLPWEHLARTHINTFFEKSEVFMETLLNQLMDEETAKALLTYWITPKMALGLENAKEALNRLFADRQGHPITYNRYYTETLQKIRADRLAKSMEQATQEYLDRSGPAHLKIGDVVKITSALAYQSFRDMDDYGSSELLDCMQAYYQIAVKTFVDNVSIQVIEVHLMANLCTLFAPIHVYQMESTLVSNIAAESEESRVLRDQLQRKRSKLEKGMEICQRHAIHHVPGLRSPVTSEVQMNSSHSPVQFSKKSKSKTDGNGTNPLTSSEENSFWAFEQRPISTPSPVGEEKQEDDPWAHIGQKTEVGDAPSSPSSPPTSFTSFYPKPKRSKKSRNSYPENAEE